MTVRRTVLILFVISYTTLSSDFYLVINKQTINNGEFELELPKFRRIVTGHNAEGKAIVLNDGFAQRTIESGEKFPVVYELWNTRETPVRVSRQMSEPEEPVTLPPPMNGTRARFLDIPPDSDITDEEARYHFQIMNGGDAMDGNAEHHSMHRTESVDVAVVLKGEIVLILDEGETVVKTGDTVIQCGTNHAWSNRTNETCRIVFFMVDGKFDADIA